MYRQVELFLKDRSKKLLILASPNSNWVSLRGRLKPCLYAILIQFLNSVPPSNFKNFLMRALLNMDIRKNASIARMDLDNIFPDLFSVGENAIIGHNVKILTHEMTQNSLRFGRVHVAKNALVGAYASLRSGVTIGEGSIVAMNSFVNKDIPPFEMWGGVPAKRIKKLR